MKPKPFTALNHLTTPSPDPASSLACWLSNRARDAARRGETWAFVSSWSRPRSVPGAATRLDLELHHIPFVQSLHTGLLKRGHVDEGIRDAGFQRDEAEACCGVEELDRAARHDA
jgi:hypothetical protein